MRPGGKRGSASSELPSYRFYNPREHAARHHTSCAPSAARMHLLPGERLGSARVNRASSPGHLLWRKHPYAPLSLTQPRGLPHNVASAGGRVAQLGEHLLCKQGVGGSNPSTSTNYLPVISITAQAQAMCAFGQGTCSGALAINKYWEY